MDNKLEAILKTNNFTPIGETNGIIKRLKGIVSNSKPNPEKLFVAEGIWLNDLINKTNTYVVSLIVCPEFIRTPEVIDLVEKLSKKSDDNFIVSEKTFLKIAEREKPDGIITISRLPKYDIKEFKTNDNSIVLVLDGIEIPGNIGTMIRVCDGAGIDGVILTHRKARLSHPKTIHSSLGSILTVPIFEFEDGNDCGKWLLDNGFKIYLADSRGEKKYFEEEYKGKTALVLGSERYGINREWYDLDHELVSIPMLGNMDSLNVGTAATILIYEAAMKKKFNLKR